MGFPKLVRLELWIILIIPFAFCRFILRIGISQVFINTTSEFISCSVIVALLCTCHDVDVMNTKLMGIFSKCFSFNTVFVGMVCAIITKIVFFIINRILRVFLILSTISVLCSYGCMQMQVFKAMNFIVYFQI